jgi:hypothetical protein
MELFKTIAARVEEDNEQQAMAENKRYTRKHVKNLILDVVTRWNSVYLMLERALEFSEVNLFFVYILECLLTSEIGNRRVDLPSQGQDISKIRALTERLGSGIAGVQVAQGMSL